jgi:hypothetical protein
VHFVGIINLIKEREKERDGPGKKGMDRERKGKRE